MKALALLFAALVIASCRATDALAPAPHVTLARTNVVTEASQPPRVSVVSDDGGVHFRLFGVPRYPHATSACGCTCTPPASAARRSVASLAGTARLACWVEQSDGDQPLLHRRRLGAVLGPALRRERPGLRRARGAPVGNRDHRPLEHPRWRAGSSDDENRVLGLRGGGRLQLLRDLPGTAAAPWSLGASGPEVSAAILHTRKAPTSCSYPDASLS